ncbi:MAG: polyphenol oxidase family protein [Desulfovibrio sp.]|jgi:YfiH family protein|nr:polyphenol oxidase family protein [Desulfovibrio sp.]
MERMKALRGAGMIPFVFPGIPRIICAFGSAQSGDIRLGRAEGDEKAVACRRAMLEAAGLDRWVELDQAHEDGFLVEPQSTPVDLPAKIRADGSCTREKNLALLIKSADCQPLFLAAPDGSAAAALHVGWRGNAINYPATGVRLFCETCGVRPAEVRAVRGPSLGPAASEFTNYATEWPSRWHRYFDREKKSIDLWRLTRDQLLDAGVPAEHIFSLDLCTFAHPGFLFSYRRGDEARQGSMIWIGET